jgi:hypothetical protein
MRVSLTNYGLRIDILNHIQDGFIYKLHAEKRLAKYVKFVDASVFGRYFVHLCAPRAILTLLAKRMEEEGVDPSDKDAIRRVNREVAKYTGHLE